MTKITNEDINALNDIIVELPPFADLNSKEMLKELFNEFLEDIYIKQLQEIYDVYDNILSEKMQETFFLNYGIDKKYSRKIIGEFKKQIAFNLEKLFQNKGSRLIFELFAHILENIFRKVNFYNIVVYKIPSDNGFHYEYRLEPLYIQDENNIIQFPIIPVKMTRKYLMTLENFKNNVIWPAATNLVYIQFSIGEEVINNMDVFLNGIRSYAVTYLRAPQKTFNYKARNGAYETIYLSDAEFITNYIKLEKIRKLHPDMDFNFPDSIGTYLPFDENDTNFAQTREEFLCLMQDLLFDYSDANYSKRSDMEGLRRRWQLFLRMNQRDVLDQYCHFSSWEEVFSFMQNRYPLLQEDIIYYVNNDISEYIQFQYSLYTNFIGAVSATQDPTEARCPLNPEYPEREIFQLSWVLDYIDVVFSSLFLDETFIKYYFNPVMDLFIRYFFPVEMDYINDLIKKVHVKDKWNSIGTEESITSMLSVNRTSLQTPIRGLDKKSFRVSMFNVKSFTTRADFYKNVPVSYVIDSAASEDQITNTIFNNIRDENRLNDRFQVTRTMQTANLSRSSSTNSETRVLKDFSTCFKNTRTKDYQVKTAAQLLSGYINKKISKGKNS